LKKKQPRITRNQAVSAVTGGGCAGGDSRRFLQASSRSMVFLRTTSVSALGGTYLANLTRSQLIRRDSMRSNSGGPTARDPLRKLAIISLVVFSKVWTE